MLKALAGRGGGYAGDKGTNKNDSDSANTSSKCGLLTRDVQI